MIDKATIKTEPFRYDGPGGPFLGTVSWNESIDGKRPAVLIAHAYGGQSAFDTSKAEELAALGYVGVAIDMYGEGRRASSEDEARALMAELINDRALLLERIKAAVAAVQELGQVNSEQLAAAGFCLGGLCVLDLARSGMEIAGVVSLHGVFSQPGPPDDAPIRTPVLLLHGWDDPLATPEETIAICAELTSRGADWQLLAFGHTGHAFTNPNAQAPERGMQYQPTSNRRAWQAMINFLQEIF